tara:strand:+ start:296 stop:535 length:240 start_codon:yes stop_codon:yes gene_type:complete
MIKVIISIIPIMTISLLVTILNSKNKTKEIASLNETIKNKELFIEELFNKKEYRYAEKLELEIMDLGSKLDSMQLKYDY